MLGLAMPSVVGWPLGGNDIFTKIMLHFDGTNGSTAFVDSNPNQTNSWSAGGTAQLDTSTSKFGSASLKLVAPATDYIATVSNLSSYNPGAGPFTVDFWFNTLGAGVGTVRFLYGPSNSTTSTGLSVWGFIDGNNHPCVSISADGATVALNVVGASTITAAGWNHYAAVRTGNIIKLFLNGVQDVADGAFSGTAFASANNYSVGNIGDYTGASKFNGNLDEFRLSIGIARWTANFPVPSRPYAP